MNIPFFAGRYLYFADIPDKYISDRRKIITDLEKELSIAIKQRDKSYSKLTNDGYITAMSEKGMWDELALEDKKLEDAQSRARNAQICIDALKKMYPELATN